MKLEAMRRQVAALSLNRYLGTVERVTGSVVESAGPCCAVDDVCVLRPRNGAPVRAQVVGFRDRRMLLMPYGELAGVRPGCEVEATGGPFRVRVGDGLIGRALDGLGRPLDGRGEVEGELRPVSGGGANPLSRPRITRPLSFGVRAVDGLLTCGRGQRIGIFAGSGVGKSTLLGMIARHSEADVNVIALVGERGREVRDFIEKDLRAEGMKRSVVVVATSDQPAMIRIQCALTATAVAEYFRDRGKSVLLMMDSLTRFAMARREVGIAAGEPPVSRGYTPSVFALLPRLLERSGNFERGSITGIYTVLVEGDDMNEPIADTVRGILDGHIVLSRRLAAKNHYPAIDVLSSISRLMPEVTSEEHQALAGRMRSLMAEYRSFSDLIELGAYKSGSNPEVDEAIARHPGIARFLCQKVDETGTTEQTLAQMRAVLGKGAA